MSKLLLVEDDETIVENLCVFLQQEGFFVESVFGQKQAIELLEEKYYDLVLLDISLADGNGFAICSYIKQNTDIPVIFLTASGDEYSVVTGLDMGADDYISKPFRPRELVSRIGVVLRRSGKASAVLESALEYRILLILFQNKGMILSREKLLEAIWDVAGDFVNDNTLTVYIKRLREKIEKEPAKPEIIKTIRGMGYGVF